MYRPAQRQCTTVIYVRPAVLYSCNLSTDNQCYIAIWMQTWSTPHIIQKSILYRFCDAHIIHVYSRLKFAGHFLMTSNGDVPLAWYRSLFHRLYSYVQLRTYSQQFYRCRKGNKIATVYCIKSFDIKLIVSFLHIIHI